MKRIEAISIVAKEAEAQDTLLVANIGFPSRELFAVSDSTSNFYMLGSMGLASSIGLGLALSVDKKVIALDGDGSVLMNLGTIATIADRDPDNYLLVILDNGCYGSTGCQATFTSRRADLARIAKGAGASIVSNVSAPEDFSKAIKGSGIVVAKVEVGNANVPVIDIGPEEILNRFMAAIAPTSP